MKNGVTEITPFAMKALRCQHYAFADLNRILCCEARRNSRTF